LEKFAKAALAVIDYCAARRQPEAVNEHDRTNIVYGHR
jgi:hypothetical protein